MAILMVGVFENEADVSQAVTKLEKAGFEPKEISFVSRNKKMLEQLSEMQHTGEPATGPGSGGILGSVREMAAAFGVLTEPVAAAGPISERAAGAGIGRGREDSLAVVLTGIGIPAPDAEAFEQYVERDCTLLILACMSVQQEKVEGIFKETGALNMQ